MNRKVAGKVSVALGGIVALVLSLIAGATYMRATNIAASTACRMAKQGLTMAHANEVGVMACHLEIHSSDDKSELNQAAIMRELDGLQARQIEGTAAMAAWKLDVVTEIRKLRK